MLSGNYSPVPDSWSFSHFMIVLVDNKTILKKKKKNGRDEALLPIFGNKK